MYNSLVLVSRRFSTSILRATVELKHSKVGGEAEFAVNSIKLENSSNPNPKRMKKLKKTGCTFDIRVLFIHNLFFASNISKVALISLAQYCTIV